MAKLTRYTVVFYYNSTRDIEGSWSTSSCGCIDVGVGGLVAKTFSWIHCHLLRKPRTIVISKNNGSNVVIWVCKRWWTLSVRYRQYEIGSCVGKGETDEDKDGKRNGETVGVFYQKINYNKFRDEVWIGQHGWCALLWRGTKGINPTGFGYVPTFIGGWGVGLEIGRCHGW